MAKLKVSKESSKFCLTAISNWKFHRENTLYYSHIVFYGLYLAPETSYQAKYELIETLFEHF